MHEPKKLKNISFSRDDLKKFKKKFYPCITVRIHLCFTKHRFQNSRWITNSTEIRNLARKKLLALRCKKRLCCWRWYHYGIWNSIKDFFKISSHCKKGRTVNIGIETGFVVSLVGSTSLHGVNKNDLCVFLAAIDEGLSQTLLMFIQTHNINCRVQTRPHIPSYIF